MAKPISKGGNDLERSGRVRTQVETQTVVEDRTSDPADMIPVEYHVKHEEIAHGTILTTYGEPVGGFPQAEADA